MEKITAKSNSQIAPGVFGRTVVAAIIGVFLYLSLSVIFSTLSTEKTGFAIYTENEDGTTTLVEKHLYTDKDYTEDIELEDGQMVITLYSPVPDGVALTMNILFQIFSLVILAAFPYRQLWAQGDHDRNEANFGHIQEDSLRGLKVGLIADIPAILVYVLLWLGKLGVPGLSNVHSLYILFNSSFLPFCYQTIGRGLPSATGISIGSMLALALPVLFLPLVCHVAYTLGLHQFSVTEKLFYKNKKRPKKPQKHR